MANLARIAYEAYSKFTGGVSLFTNDQLPEWENIGQTTRVAWDAAAEAVVAEYVRHGQEAVKSVISQNPSGGTLLELMKSVPREASSGRQPAAGNPVDGLQFSQDPYNGFPLLDVRFREHSIHEVAPNVNMGGDFQKSSIGDDPQDIDIPVRKMER